MASTAVRTAVKNRLAAGFTDIPVRLPNAAGADLQMPSTPSAFAQLVFPGAVEDQITIGAPDDNIFRETGAFMIHVFVPKGTGDNQAATYAESIRVLFRGKSFDGVTCEAPFAPQEGERYGGNYWGISFGVPYYFDHNA